MQEEAKIDDSKFEQVEEVQDDEILKNEEKVQKEIKDETVSEEKKGRDGKGKRRESRGGKVRINYLINLLLILEKGKQLKRLVTMLIII